MALLDRIARLAIAAPFVWLGAEAALAPGARVGMAVDLGIPESVAPQLVRLNGATMVAGGLGIALGVGPGLAGAALTASMIPTTLAGHSFWKEDDPMARKLNRIHFLKNVGLLGAALAIAARPRRQKKRRPEPVS
jgi:putative oxidoreductase